MRAHPCKKQFDEIAAYNKAQHLSRILMRTISAVLGVNRIKLIEHNRKREFSDARAIYVYLMHKNGIKHKLTLHFINRERSAYLYSVKKAKNLISTGNVEFTSNLNKVEAQFNKLRSEQTAPTEKAPTSLFNRF